MRDRPSIVRTTCRNRPADCGAIVVRREQFTVGNHKVFAHEHFELQGDRALRYRFDVSDEKGRVLLFRVSPGSYALTNQIAREVETVKKGERIFHLDYYGGREHRTYGMFTKEPSYEETRRLVTEVILGKREPISGTAYGDSQRKQ